MGFESNERLLKYWAVHINKEVERPSLYYFDDSISDTGVIQF